MVRGTPLICNLWCWICLVWVWVSIPWYWPMCINVLICGRRSRWSVGSKKGVDASPTDLIGLFSFLDLRVDLRMCDAHVFAWMCLSVVCLHPLFYCWLKWKKDRVIWNSWRVPSRDRRLQQHLMSNWNSSVVSFKPNKAKGTAGLKGSLPISSAYWSGASS